MKKNKCRDHLELPAECLRWTCDPAVIPFKTTKEANPLDGVIGQKRATEALALGLELRAPGYNVYACGQAGTGKLSTVRRLLNKMPKSKEKPKDILFLNNFKNPREPIAVKLPAGKGGQFKKDMHRLVVELREAIPNLFDHKEFKAKRDTMVEGFRDEQKTLFRNLEAEIGKRRFAMVQVQMGTFVRPAILPVIENQPVPFEQLEQMAANGNFPGGKLKDLQKTHQKLHRKLEAAMKRSRALDRRLKEEIVKLEQSLAAGLVISLVDELREKYDEEALQPYFNEMATFTLENIVRFKEPDHSDNITLAAEAMQGMEAPENDYYHEWEVNVLVDNSSTVAPSIIVENTPSYRNLFGNIEKSFSPNGAWTTDFMKIQAGSILQADGGFLLFHIGDALIEPGVWKALKRFIKSKKVEIESVDSLLFYMSSALKPQGIEADVKIIVIGESRLYYLLLAYDEDFKKLFKVRADFDTVMEKTNDSVVKSARFITQVINNEKLPHFDKTALCALIEECVSIAGQQDKLTTKFSVLADIVRETAYWARKSKSRLARAGHVRQALESRRLRRNLYEEKLQEAIEKERILISTTGKAIGQINALSVYQVGDYYFGRPTRITAKVGMGRGGIINIEREAKLSGKTYDKGMLIMVGFLRHRFAGNKPLSLSASITFEQSYGGVDGDSASSAEVYALFSALAKVPINQSIAVTGSINQSGYIQPIGGANEKIEGFFRVCKARRLTGRQGVIIPIQNLDDLMLPAEVVDAVKKKKFHIWAISHVDEGLEILTGIPTGKRGAGGRFPKASMNERVDQRLMKLARDLQDFGKDKKKAESTPSEKKKKTKRPAKTGN